jgi:hypothetical protein
MRIFNPNDYIINASSLFEGPSLEEEASTEETSKEPELENENTEKLQETEEKESSGEQEEAAESPYQGSYIRTLITTTDIEPSLEQYHHVKPKSIGLIDGWNDSQDRYHDTLLPSLENAIVSSDAPSTNPMQPNSIQQFLKQMFFIRTDSAEKDYTVSFQLGHDKIRDVFTHFFDTRLESHNVHILLGTAMSLKDNNPSQIWRINSLISSIQLSRAASITAYAYGWLDATETLIWCFCPNRYIAENSYAVLTFDWNGFDYIAAKKNIHKQDQERFIERFKNLGILTDEECDNYRSGQIIMLTADEIAIRLKQHGKVES